MLSKWGSTVGAFWAVAALAACGTPEVVSNVDAGEVADAGGIPDAGGGIPDAGGPTYDETFNGGTLRVTADGTTLGYTTIDGSGGMIRQVDGKTDILISVTGLHPTTVYAAHVHASRCDDNGGGPHYKKDAAIADTQEANELWVSIMTDANGAGVGYLRADHYTRADANAVVIHEPGGVQRIACATLYASADLTATGAFNLLPDGTGLNITGTATLRRYAGGTVARVRLAGTFPSTMNYGVHVHAKPCADELGGPHYKIDTNVTETVATNEIWIDGMHNGATMVEGATAIMHLARYDAWSMVVHDPVTKNRILCADLRW